MNPSISISHLQKKFGRLQAIQDLTLQITSGQIYGLLGPNGAGKTTLIRMLIGATKPTSGRMSVLGFNPTRQKHQIRKLIGYMPQSAALYEDLSARENIRFFGFPHRSQQFNKYVDQIIDFVGLSQRANDPIYKFSGGMKQRVSLACALVHQPKLLLLDEPTTGIDPKLRQSFWQHFRDLTQQGVTILVSTHQMSEAMYCDRLAIMHEGVLLADQAPRQLLWEKKATIRLRRGKTAGEKVVSDYPTRLPRVLRQFGLDPTIERIEIEEETLEEVVLEMIRDHERKSREGTTS